MIGQRAHKGETIGCVGQAVVIGEMRGLALVRGQLGLLLLKQRHRRGERAIGFPALTERGGGLHHFLGLERLGDEVHRAQRNQVGRDAARMHQDEGKQQRQRNHGRHDQRRAPVTQKHHEYGDHQQGAHNQVF